MDTEAAGDFHDWEVLPDSDSSGLNNSGCLEGIEHESEGMIRFDYFSLDSQTMHAAIQGDCIDDNSVESDNPSWIDPDIRYSTVKEKGGFWSSDGSDDGKYAEFEAKNQVDIVAGAKNQGGYDVIGADSIEISARFSSGTGEIGSKPSNYENIMAIYDEEDGKNHNMEMEPSGEETVGDVSMETRDDGENAYVVAKAAAKPGGPDRSRGPLVWWKVPLDLLKYCLFKANPVWTISVAAAMMSAIILGRRLYKMKHKSRSLQLKVTLDDKKASQFMSRAARLNEAFSVVKRSPIIRPSLPAAGVATWPMMSLR